MSDIIHAFTFACSKKEKKKKIYLKGISEKGNRNGDKEKRFGW